MSKNELEAFPEPEPISLEETVRNVIRDKETMILDGVSLDDYNNLFTTFKPDRRACKLSIEYNPDKQELKVAGL
jgi:hypothetical protein